MPSSDCGNNFVGSSARRELIDHRMLHQRARYPDPGAWGDRLPRPQEVTRHASDSQSFGWGSGGVLGGLRHFRPLVAHWGVMADAGEFDEPVSP